MNSSHGQRSLGENVSLVNCWPCYVFLHLPKHEVIGVRDCCHTCLSYEITCFLLDCDFIMISSCCHNLSQVVSSQKIKSRYLIHLDPGQVIFSDFSGHPSPFSPCPRRLPHRMPRCPRASGATRWIHWRRPWTRTARAARAATRG